MDGSSIGVIILTHNDPEHAVSCLTQVMHQTEKPRRIVVCDNGSDDQSADRVFREWERLSAESGREAPVEVFGEGTSLDASVFLRLEENAGVPAGYDAALSLLLYDKSCEAFWLLHDDAEPAAYALSALVRHLDDESPKKIGIVGSTLLYSDKNIVECAAGGEWRSWTGRAFLLDSGLDRYAMSDRKDIAEKLDFVHGASCLITRELIDAIGLFDPRFRQYYEDVEYGLRAKKAGFALNWAPGAVVRHRGSGASELSPVRTLQQEPELSEDNDYCYIRNRFYLLKRERPVAIPYALITLPIPLSTRYFRGQKGRLKLVVRAACDGIGGRM